ncbi:glutathione S-transferase [Lophium mytilinum]|uniref:Glutathione S-transferase n=1 Tax=Lophium mytilinum TaxID=390894 RepID=A0A6A6R116_9PEZI|nr:glutathione S-transferase [Lophium mytilinum]
MSSPPTPFATLYTTPNFLHARTTKALAAAHLNSLPLHLPPDFIFGTTNRTPAFLAKFPMGKIPALETATGFYLSEATAIAHYLADSGPKRLQLLGSSPEERAEIQMWISLSDSEIFPNMGAVMGPMMGTAAYDAGVVERGEEAYLRAVRRVETHLKGRKWLVNQNAGPSLADLSVASALFWPFKFMLDGEARGEFPETVGWYTRLLEVEEVREGFGGMPQFCEKRGPAVKGG